MRRRQTAAVCRGGAIAEDGTNAGRIDKLVKPTLVLLGNSYVGNKGKNGGDILFTYAASTKLSCPGSSW